MDSPQRPPISDSRMPLQAGPEQSGRIADPNAPGKPSAATRPHTPAPHNSSPNTPTTDLPAADASRLLGELKREMNRLQREIRLAIQTQLGQMSGRSLGSIEANQELVRSIQEMLDSHGLRVRCNQCGHPAILRVSPRSGATTGVFVFDHTIDGHRTFHGGRILMPEIRLVSKPSRKPRGEKKVG